MSGPDAISPTAHDTGYVWARNGLSHPALVTAQGRALFTALQPVMLAVRAFSGPSLEAYLLARHRGLAVITEGLTGYLSPDDLAGLWRRIATVAGSFDAGRYLSDLHLGGSPPPQVRAFGLLLAAFVRGRVHLHFPDGAHAEAALRAAGFADARVTPARPPADARVTPGSSARRRAGRDGSYT